VLVKSDGKTVYYFALSMFLSSGPTSTTKHDRKCFGLFRRANRICSASPSKRDRPARLPPLRDRCCSASTPKNDRICSTSPSTRSAPLGFPLFLIVVRLPPPSAVITLRARFPFQRGFIPNNLKPQTDLRCRDQLLHQKACNFFSKKKQKKKKKQSPKK